MSDLLDAFLVEARELAETAAAELMALERAPADAARLDGLFRAVHTLKGSVGLFDLAPMGAALHAAEDLLDAARAGQMALGRAAIDSLLELIGAVETWVEEVAALGGTLPAAAAGRAGDLEASLRALLPGTKPTGGSSPAAAGPSAADWLAPLLARAVAAEHAAGRGVTALRYVPAEDCFFLGDDPMAVVRALPGLVALHVAPRQPWPEAGPDPFTCNLVIEAVVAAPGAALRPLLRLVADQVRLAELPPPAGTAPPPAPEAAPAAPPRALRVDAGRVDALVDLAGELVVAKNRLAHLVERAAGADPALARALAESRAGIERLAEAMHRGVLGLRMVPLGRSLNRLPRSSREIAGRLGKEVAFHLEGEAVEADKAVVDGLFEPLLHLLRNALDHGIESPAERAAAGKPRAGRIALRASRGGVGILVEMSDDGRGMDPARLRAVAVARGLLDPAAAAVLDDDAALDLVFRPGFSTAGTVTDVSGRGVGMDAVRTAVEALGGRVALLSAPGAGATVRLTLPQGAAVSTVLLVRAGGEVFGVPVEAVAETLRVPAPRILPLRQAEAFVLRDRTVPLLRLAGLLGLSAAPRGEVARVLLTGAGAGRAGLEVEGFAGRLDVLLRPPEGLLRGMPGMLGTALLGDGRVLVVLDLPALIDGEGAG
ncbi:chemotaxis protein CheA [Roseomonas sp. KE2513]|uniref:chemotaxis protein CheA n=1 Tax=Roseomonas sp. KE2513 TaxID=2479202 RepID=UPI0018DF76EF|nr:chemotaxis protein CheA [Roseomonas sp. KE2513]MBI0537591.1 chemotaxis protein CheA [Roseomonas sp. KE2513]